MKTTALLSTILWVTVAAGGYAFVRGTDKASDSSNRPISRMELEPIADNVYDALKVLRSGWIQSGSIEGPGDRPRVYIEARCSEITCLRWVDSDHVERVHFVNAGQTVPTWPLPSESGAIIVELRTRATAVKADVDNR